MYIHTHTYTCTYTHIHIHIRLGGVGGAAPLGGGAHLLEEDAEPLVEALPDVGVQQVQVELDHLQVPRVPEPRWGGGKRPEGEILPAKIIPTKIIPTKLCGLKLSGEFPMDIRIPPLKIKILLESNLPKSRILVGRLAVRCAVRARVSAARSPDVAAVPLGVLQVGPHGGRIVQQLHHGHGLEILAMFIVVFCLNKQQKTTTKQRTYCCWLLLVLRPHP